MSSSTTPVKSPPPSPGEPNQQLGILVTTVLVATIAVLFVALRFITRRWIVKSIGWDDWCILGAAFGNPIGCALVIVEVSYGFGRHKKDLSPHDYREFEKYAYGEWMQTFATLMFTKVSICLFLLRIVISKAFIRSLQAFIVILVGSNVILTILWIVQCRPLSDAWVDPMAPGYCFSKGQLQRIIIAQAIISIVSDFILATYPILILRRIQMKLRIKVGLCILMGLGVITGSLCTVRTVYNWQNVSDDPTWDSIPNWYWRTWEVCIGIVVACIPTLHPGYKSLRARIRTYSRSRSTHATSLRKQSERNSKPNRPSHEETAGNLTAYPMPAFRPDRGNVSAMITTGTTDDGLGLPMQNFEIRKTTQIDLESQRSHSGLDGNGDGGWERVDSETDLRGGGILT